MKHSIVQLGMLEVVYRTQEDFHPISKLRKLGLKIGVWKSDETHLRIAIGE